MKVLGKIADLFDIRTFRVATLLASRFLLRTSKWQTALVIFVMMLTFLNLVAINGILVGLIDGALLAYNNRYAGDLFISKLPEKENIERTSAIRTILSQHPSVAAYSERIVEGATLEANYQRSVSQPNIVPDRISLAVAGININEETAVTNLSDAIVEGAFLTETDGNSIVLGGLLIDRYFPAEVGLQTVSEVYPGDKVRLTVGNARQEFTVKGIIKTKADAADLRAYVLANELKKMTSVYEPGTDEFAIRLTENANIPQVQADILSYGVGNRALVRTTGEAIGEFLDEIKDTFKVVGNIIGAISVIVASITIFIIIFITAITRRKYIGILKAIGVSAVTIELSYVMLSIFYSLIGVSLGVLILYSILLPYFFANPIDFPFSDGILSVSTFDTVTRSLVLIITTIIAGYLPARFIVNKNTLDAILGR